MTITLRLEKGSELTFQELDNNFSDLNGRVTTLESGSGSGGIALTDLSVTTNIASGGGTLTYSNATGVFTYTPPDLSSYTTTAGLNTAIDGHLNTGTATANQILSWDGADYAWVADAASTEANTVVFTARADANLLMGEVVYITGISGNTPTIDKAQANAAGTMPAFGIVKEDVTANNNVEVITFGSCPGHDAANFAETGITFALGDTVYVSATEAGKLTNVAPASESNLIQNIGKIERATPTTNMTLKVGGAGRSNATPALDEGNIFIGDAQNRSSTVSFNSTVDAHLNTSTATANQVLSWDGADYAWVADQTGGGGATNMASLIDVDSVDTVASGDFLLFDGSSSEYKFVAFEAEVNGLIDSRTGSSGHIATQAQYAGTITSDPADPTDTAHHTLGNTGTPSVQGASTAWYYGDVVSDPANPTTTVVLDIDQQRFTGAVQSDNISLGSPGSFTAQAGATLDLQGTTINFGSATIMGGNAFNDTINNHLWSGSTQPTNGYVLSWNTALLSGNGDYEWIAQGGGTWATLGDKDGANGPAAIILGQNAVGGIESVAIGKGTHAGDYAQAIGNNAGNTGQGQGAVALGSQAGETGQEQKAIAIGNYAGQTGQGGNAIAIGEAAGRASQTANSIIINATGADLNNAAPSTFTVKPIRNAPGAQALYYDPTSGEVTYDAAPGGGGGGTGLQSRTTATATTGSIPDGSQVDLDITGFKSYGLLSITTDRAARVRLYVSSATRSADVSRAEGVDPTSDAGLIAEVITTGAETVIISPGAFGFNLEVVPTSIIPCRVTNKSGSSSTVQVDLNIVQLEA
jgi:hypothetical protein